MLVGDHFVKLLFSVFVTSNMSVEGFESRARNKITTLQYKCSLLDIFPLFLTGNFLVVIIIIDIKYMWYDGMNWIQMTQDTVL
jgi:hypothetical protein